MICERNVGYLRSRAYGAGAVFASRVLNQLDRKLAGVKGTKSRYKEEGCVGRRVVRWRGWGVRVWEAGSGKGQCVAAGKSEVGVRGVGDGVETGRVGERVAQFACDMESFQGVSF